MKITNCRCSNTPLLAAGWFIKSHRGQKRFWRDIEHFRNETEVLLSVEDHELFEGLRPEFL